MENQRGRLRFLALTERKPEQPLFLFLPGMDGSSLSLKQQQPYLEADFELRCMVMPPDDQTDWFGLLTALGDFLEAERRADARREIYLCGESFGGCFAYQGGLRYPNLIDRLVLINPATCFSQQAWRNLSPFVVRWLSPVLYQLGANGLLPFLLAVQRVALNNRRALLAATQAVTPASAAWRLGLLRDFRDDIALAKRLRRPVLLVASQRDRLLPSVSEVQRLSQLFPMVKTLVLEHSGHACLLETDVSLGKIFGETGFMPGSGD